MFVRHLLVPTDFSERSGVALRYATVLAESLRAEIDLLHVVAPAFFATRVVDAYLGQARAQVDDNAMADAERRLKTLSRELRSDVRVRTMAEFGEVVDVIVRLARQLPSDLIVMATHARRGVAELALGSVTHRVIASAPCPVVSMRGEEARR